MIDRDLLCRLAHESAQRMSRADLDEELHAHIDHRLQRLGEVHAVTDLFLQHLAQITRFDFSAHVIDDRDLFFAKRIRIQHFAQLHARLIEQ